MPHCQLPLTGKRCVHSVLTEPGWFDTLERPNGSRGLVLTEVAPGETVDGIRERTAARFEVSPELRHVGV